MRSANKGDEEVRTTRVDSVRQAEFETTHGLLNGRCCTSRRDQKLTVSVHWRLAP